MDYSSMLRMSYELNPDTFEAGKSYQIKIHRQEVFSRVVEVSLCRDDDYPYDITKAYKSLYSRLDKVGVDAICISASTREVEFITSTRDVRGGIVKMIIRITLDVILAANNNKHAGETPAIEII